MAVGHIDIVWPVTGPGDNPGAGARALKRPLGKGPQADGVLLVALRLEAEKPFLGAPDRLRFFFPGDNVDLRLKPGSWASLANHNQGPACKDYEDAGDGERFAELAPQLFRHNDLALKPPYCCLRPCRRQQHQNHHDCELVAFTNARPGVRNRIHHGRQRQVADGDKHNSPERSQARMQQQSQAFAARPRQMHCERR